MANIYVNSSWTESINGTKPVAFGVEQSETLTLGTNAFKSIEEALGKLQAGDSLFLFGATDLAGYTFPDGVNVYASTGQFSESGKTGDYRYLEDDEIGKWVMGWKQISGTANISGEGQSVDRLVGFDKVSVTDGAYVKDIITGNGVAFRKNTESDIDGDFYLDGRELKQHLEISNAAIGNAYGFYSANLENAKWEHIFGGFVKGDFENNTEIPPASIDLASSIPGKDKECIINIKNVTDGGSVSGFHFVNIQDSSISFLNMGHEWVATTLTVTGNVTINALKMYQGYIALPSEANLTLGSIEVNGHANEIRGSFTLKENSTLTITRYDEGYGDLTIDLKALDSLSTLKSVDMGGVLTIENQDSAVSWNTLYSTFIGKSTYRVYSIILKGDFDAAGLTELTFAYESGTLQNFIVEGSLTGVEAGTTIDVYIKGKEGDLEHGSFTVCDSELDKLNFKEITGGLRILGAGGGPASITSQRLLEIIDGAGGSANTILIEGDLSGTKDEFQSLFEKVKSLQVAGQFGSGEDLTLELVEGHSLHLGRIAGNMTINVNDGKLFPGRELSVTEDSDLVVNGNISDPEAADIIAVEKGAKMTVNGNIDNKSGYLVVQGTLDSNGEMISSNLTLWDGGVINLGGNTYGAYLNGNTAGAGTVNIKEGVTIGFGMLHILDDSMTVTINGDFNAEEEGCFNGGIEIRNGGVFVFDAINLKYIAKVPDERYTPTIEVKGEIRLKEQNADAVELSRLLNDTGGSTYIAHLIIDKTLVGIDDLTLSENGLVNLTAGGLEGQEGGGKLSLGNRASINIKGQVSGIKELIMTDYDDYSMESIIAAFAGGASSAETANITLGRKATLTIGTLTGFNKIVVAAKESQTAGGLTLEKVDGGKTEIEGTLSVKNLSTINGAELTATGLTVSGELTVKDSSVLTTDASTVDTLILENGSVTALSTENKFEVKKLLVSGANEITGSVSFKKASIFEMEDNSSLTLDAQQFTELTDVNEFIIGQNTALTIRGKAQWADAFLLVKAMSFTTMNFGSIINFDNLSISKDAEFVLGTMDGMFGTEKNDSIKIGKYALTTLNTSIDLLEGKNKIDVSANALLAIAGDTKSINTLNVSKGATYKENGITFQGRTSAMLGGAFTGTAENDIINAAQFTTVSIVGEIDLFGGKNTVKIGGNSNFEAGASVRGINKFTVANSAVALDALGRKVQGWSRVSILGTLAGTAENDTVTIGNYTHFSAGSVDLAGGKNKVSIGVNSDFILAGDLLEVNNFRLTNTKFYTDGRTQDYTTATIGGKLTGTADADTVQVGKNTYLQVNGNMNLSDGKNKVNLAADSQLILGGDLFGANSFKMANGKTYFGSVTEIAGSVYGTNYADTFQLGNFAVVVIGRNLALLDGKNKVTAGSNAALKIGGDMLEVNSLRASNGKLYTSEEGREQGFTAIEIAGDLTGTDANDSIKLGNYVVLEIGGNINLGGGTKDSLSLGSNSKLRLNGTLTSANIVVSIGKDSVVEASSEAAASIVSSAKLHATSKIYDIGSADGVARNFTTQEKENADDSLESESVLSNGSNGWLSNMQNTETVQYYTDLQDYFRIDQVKSGASLDGWQVGGTAGSLDVKVWTLKDGAWTSTNVAESDQGGTWDLSQAAISDATDYRIAVGTTENKGVFSYALTSAV